jgi:tRNA dimethylallyltransferase
MISPVVSLIPQTALRTAASPDTPSFFIALVGPTAAGKTALAVELAKAIGGEIVTLDSMQVYRSMDIGTAKPTPEAQREIPHHLIDVVDPWEPFTAVDYALLARAALKDIHARGRLPLVVGGSGLYLRALCGEIFNGPREVTGIRTRLTQEMKTGGPALLHARLTHLDPARAEKIHPNDAFRLIRALEIIEITGRRVSDLWGIHRRGLMRPSILLLGLRRERTALYDRINDRVDQMVALGLVEEVDRLLKAGHPPNLKPLRSHNYRHIIAYLLGQHGLEEAVRRTKQETRHYAKRQMTWFRSKNEITWFDVTDSDSARTTTLLIEHIQRRREQHGTSQD